MPKRHETKLYWKERAERAERDASITAHGLYCAMHSKPVATETWRGDSDKRDKYTARLYHPCAPHGGILLVTFEYPGQRPSTTAHYFEDWYRETLRCARALGRFDVFECAERLRRARREALDALMRTDLPEKANDPSQTDTILALSR
jgi:hypothetical protein